MLPKCIWITPGNLDGIGLEITVKAIEHLRVVNHLNKDLALIVLSHESDRWAWPRLQSLKPKMQDQIHPPEAGGFYVVKAPARPAYWVEVVAQLCFSEPRRHMLITGPLDKAQFLQEGYQVMGHTGLLAQVAQLTKDDLFMYFLGSSFDVVLLTDHVPLSDVSLQLAAERLKSRLCQLHRSLRGLPHPLRTRIKKLKLLGLNPHAGDGGLISSWENEVLLPAWRSLEPWPWPWEGPLPSDSAFTQQDFKASHPLYIAHYHDQGLIPFKLVHGSPERIPPWVYPSYVYR
jgi:4-hydroxy-L-threonine phosphate dehydrogenase PdxA